MSFIDKLESKIGRFAIKNLMLYLIALYVIGFIINVIDPSIYIEYLSLDAYAILHGQVWRIITYLCYPPSTNLIFFLLLSFIYFTLGRTLEQVWGKFKFNLYIFVGVLANVLAAIIIYLIFDRVYLLTASQLYLTMLLGMAVTFPNISFLLFFILPIKAKWLGIFYGAFEAIKIISAIIMGDFAQAIEIFMSLLNFILFVLLVVKPQDRFRQARRAQEFKMKYDDGAKQVKPVHRCAVCGITNIDAPNMEFRYCSKCKGAYEYCSNHLYTHEHIGPE